MTTRSHPAPHTLALAGAGHIAAVHTMAAVASGNVRITNVASRTPDRAAELAGQILARACTYAQLPGEAEAVLVSTPPPCHVNDAIQALQAGAAVIVEKPIATTLDDADRLFEASEASGGRVGYAENLAFAPIIREALHHKRNLGAIHHLELRVLQARPTWGDFLQASWGGGVLFDLGAHPIAIALLLAAPARPTEVSAHLEGASDIEVDEHATLTLTFDSGLRAHLTVSWRGEGAARVWDLQAASATGVLRVELSPRVGLEIDGELVPLPEGRRGVPSPQLEQMGYIDQLESLLDAFRAGTTPRMGASFGRDVLDVTCAAYRSARHHGRLEPLPFTGPRDRTPHQLWRD